MDPYVEVARILFPDQEVTKERRSIAKHFAWAVAGYADEPSVDTEHGIRVWLSGAFPSLSITRWLSSPSDLRRAARYRLADLPCGALGPRRADRR